MLKVHSISSDDVVRPVSPSGLEGSSSQEWIPDPNLSYEEREVV